MFGDIRGGFWKRKIRMSSLVRPNSAARRTGAEVGDGLGGGDEGGHSTLPACTTQAPATTSHRECERLKTQALPTFDDLVAEIQLEIRAAHLFDCCRVQSQLKRLNHKSHRVRASCCRTAWTLAQPCGWADPGTTTRTQQVSISPRSSRRNRTVYPMIRTPDCSST